jgi:signal transduction histidine kinase/putative methionine-R-sulfoxide reductase with GAF domain
MGSRKPHGQVAWEARVVMTASPTDDLASAERRIQELTKELSRARGELAEAQDQQAATVEILRVISSSPTDLQPVFAVIAGSAARLCDAYDAVIRQVDGEVLRLVAHNGPIPAPGTIPLSRSSLLGCAVIDRRTIHAADQQSEAEYLESRNRALQFGHRTALGVPLVHAGEAVGVILIRRTEVRPFTDRQIELLKTFADQAVIAIENTRLFEAEQESKRELQESLEYQTATSEVLDVISRSPAELQPVLNTIVETAGRLCKADHAHVFRLKDGKYHLVAHNQTEHHIIEYLSTNPIGLDQLGSVTARAARACKTVHVPDSMQDPEYGHGPLTFSNDRTVLSVPLLREGVALGVLTVGRQTLGPFASKEIELVESFADQAVIAIENTRLFEAEQASKRELQESLEYQTAISEVLGVISRAPSELQPVLNAIVATARGLCDAERAVVWQIDEDQFRPIAFSGLDTSAIEKIAHHRLPIGSGSVLGRAADECRAVQVLDAALDNTLSPAQNELAQAGNIHSILAVPLMRDGRPTGCLSVSRTIVQSFSNRQVALLETFADQAVIAIENTRLFEAEQTRTRQLEARTRELTESLQQQTATANVLKVISRSTFVLQPVLDTLLENATRLCDAESGHIWRFEGEVFRATASYGVPKERKEFFERNPIRPGRGSAIGRAALDRRTVQIPDALADPEYQLAESQRVGGYRTLLGVPMLREDALIGVFSLVRSQVQPFTDKQIDLVTTFADQAVIAIENVRLFEEVQARTLELTESLNYQTATSEVLNVISRSKFDLQPVLDTIARTASTLCDGANSTILLREADGLSTVAHHGPLPTGGLRSLDRSWVPGRAVLDRVPIHAHDLLAAQQEFPLGYENAKQQGHRTSLAIPLLREGFAIGSFLLRRSVVQPFTEKEIALLQTFADQAVIAIENTRLFEEVQARTRELAQTVEDLEIASQHKNQFVANMSHELRTPLAAILGYAELIQEGFYEPQGPKSLDALTRIRSNGKHLLGLINTVLDIAKIESGQFTLNMSEYAIESVVETVRAATESLAQNKKLTLTTSVERSLPVGLGDEQRLTQVLLNLVGNAIKFTDAGEVRIAAGACNGHFAVSVTDTGPGIPLDQQGRIFEQFHQVDSSLTKAKGGTGLGLAIAREIVEMHGGRIWVESTLGKGSIFQMELPIRAEYGQRAP